MSGGVDSSVAAALLKKEGYQVTGITMNLTGDAHLEWANRAADTIGIPLESIDIQDRFRTTVIDAFVRSYAAGLTPNPCVVCNFEIKFGAFLEYAMAQGADKLATGHYARITEVNSKPKTENREEENEELRLTVNGSRLTSYRLLKGIDSKKDQSYFLYRLQRRQLGHLLFPLGDLKKDDVKNMAREIGFPQADMKESQDVCFIPGGQCGKFLANMQDGRVEPVDIVDESGRVLGTHNGIRAFTVGQRKGLRLGGSAASEDDTEPLYVLSIDARARRIVVGPRDAGYKTTVRAIETAWITGQPPASSFQATAKIRYNSPGAKATVTTGDDNSAEVIFDEPQFAPAPGQSLVLYDGDTVLGGGIISSSY